MDERGGNGLYLLTGSEQFRLSGAVSQSLAGRTALLTLLPFSLASLGADAGVSHKTTREWLSILEASYVVFQLPPPIPGISANA